MVSKCSDCYLSKLKNIGKKFELLENTDLQKLFTEMLDYFDTGIDGIDFKEIDFNKVDVPNEVKEDIKNDLLRRNQKKGAFYLILKMINII